MKVAHFIIAILGFIPFASTNASPISSDAELAAQFNKLPRILTHQSHPLLQRDPDLKSRQSDFGLWFLEGLPSGWCTFSTHADPDNHLITWSIFDSYGNNIGVRQMSVSLDGDGARYDYPISSGLSRPALASAQNFGNRVWVIFNVEWSGDCHDMEPDFPNPACAIAFKCML